MFIKINKKLYNLRFSRGGYDPPKEKGPMGPLIKKWGPGPMIFWGAQGPCTEKKKFALGRDFFFSGKGGPWGASRPMGLKDPGPGPGPTEVSVNLVYYTYSITLFMVLLGLYVF